MVQESCILANGTAVQFGRERNDYDERCNKMDLLWGRGNGDGRIKKRLLPKLITCSQLDKMELFLTIYLLLAPKKRGKRGQGKKFLKKRACSGSVQRDDRVQRILGGFARGRQC